MEDELLTVRVETIGFEPKEIFGFIGRTYDFAHSLQNSNGREPNSSRPLRLPSMPYILGVDVPGDMCWFIELFGMNGRAQPPVEKMEGKLLGTQLSPTGYHFELSDKGLLVPKFIISDRVIHRVGEALLEIRNQCIDNLLLVAIGASHSILEHTGRSQLISSTDSRSLLFTRAFGAETAVQLERFTKNGFNL